MDLIIRPASLADAPAIAQILIALGWWQRLNPGESSRIEKRIRAELEQAAPQGARFVAQEEGGPVLGYTAVYWIPYLFLEGPEGYVTELFVAQEARGKGIGTRLLAKAEEEARKQGCARLLLHNGRNRDSYRQGFYAKHGWQEREGTAVFVRYLDPQEQG